MYLCHSFRFLTNISFHSKVKHCFLNLDKVHWKGQQRDMRNTLYLSVTWVWGRVGGWRSVAQGGKQRRRGCSERWRLCVGEKRTSQRQLIKTQHTSQVKVLHKEANGSHKLTALNTLLLWGYTVNGNRIKTYCMLCAMPTCTVCMYQARYYTWSTCIDLRLILQKTQKLLHFH